jgi:hypothetical protein
MVKIPCPAHGSGGLAMIVAVTMSLIESLSNLGKGPSEAWAVE